MNTTEGEARDNIEDLIEHVEKYVETQGKLAKLKAVEQSSLAAGAIISNLVILLFFLFVFLFLSFAAAYFISDYFEKNYIGFVLVGAFYFLIAMILFSKRESFLQTKISNAMIKNIFKSNEQD